MSRGLFLFFAICAMSVGTIVNYSMALNNTSGSQTYTSGSGGGTGGGFSGGHK